MIRWFARLAAATLLANGAVAFAQDGPVSPPNAAGITAPAEAFAQEPGSDYFLADYTAYEAYLQTLAQQSDRMRLVDIGESAEGRTQWMAIVSSPENLAQLDTYQGIARRLAKAEGLSDDEAHELARQGKAVVWIDAGLHATETVTTQGQVHVLYRMLTQSDPETLDILDNIIVLFGQANPDGLELVADWYMRRPDPLSREFGSIPRLYQKYIGHDNNRDFFMSQMPETTNINRVLFREWFPQIIYNQHQTGPSGQVVFVPPFRDPFNYNYDPLVVTELNEVGAVMHSSLIAEGKGGSAMRSAANYSTWHNGMLRSISYFHNSIGLLTEIIGGPTPERIPLVPEMQLPSNDQPLPVEPQMWHLRDTLEYQWTMNRAVMDYAARNRERLLFNVYRMGANNIERGSNDSWTVTPKKIEALKDAAGDGPPPTESGLTGRSFATSDRVATELYGEVLQAPGKRDPRGYVIPAGQADMPTVTAFINALIKTGVDVMRATAPFSVAGEDYPAGSYGVKTGQAYRPHVLDMFEPQDHPHDFEYPGGPPVAPYDITGYTLAYQMGVDFDRVLDGFDGPFEPVPDLLTPDRGRVIGGGRAGWLVDHRANNSFILTNRLLAAGVPVSWVTDPVSAGGSDLPAGAVWIPYSAQAASIVTQGTGELGIDAIARGSAPSGSDLLALKRPRVGLVDKYGGVIASGWTRWLLEQYEFPFSVVYPQELDAGDLNAKYDVLVFADGTGPADPSGIYGNGREGDQPNALDIPEEFRPWLGQVSAQDTALQVAEFVRAGGTLVTVGSANYLAELVGVRADAALVDDEGEGRPGPLARKDFYIPGSLIEASVDNTQPLAFGMPETVDVFFDDSQSFTATGESVTRVAWFDSEDPLRSGWALGEDKLEGTIAVLDADVGEGKVFMMGPEVTQRAQPYATFKLLFNGLLYGPAANAR